MYFLNVKFRNGVSLNIAFGNDVGTHVSQIYFVKAREVRISLPTFYRYY